MTTFVLDSGALLRLERDDRELWAMVHAQAGARTNVLVPTGVVAQVWRRGHRQALVARALQHCDEIVLDSAIARASGLLCGATGTSDIVDASVALAAAVAARSERTVVLTSDPSDLRRLLDELGTGAEVVPV